MGRLPRRAHLQCIGVEENIAMILNRTSLHDYGIPARNGAKPAPVPPFAISRRDLLGGVGGLLATPMFSAKARAPAPAPKRLTPGTRGLGVNGRAARAFWLPGPQ